jgi:hypothetical protein
MRPYLQRAKVRLPAVLIDPKIVSKLCGGCIILTASISFFTEDWTWFQRSGAICSTLGVLLAIRSVVRKGVSQAVEDSQITDGGHASPTPAEIAAHQQLYIDGQAQFVGSSLSILGAVISAFGDLVGWIR